MPKHIHKQFIVLFVLQCYNIELYVFGWYNVLLNTKQSKTIPQSILTQEERTQIQFFVNGKKSTMKNQII